MRVCSLSVHFRFDRWLSFLRIRILPYQPLKLLPHPAPIDQHLLDAVLILGMLSQQRFGSSCVTISVMNWDQMKNNVGARVQLKPTPHRLDDYGRKLPSVADEWIIEEVSAEGRTHQERADGTHDDPGQRSHLRVPLQS